MIREEARLKAVDMLLGEKNNNNFYASLFEKYNYEDPEMTPISPICMPNVNKKHTVVITEEAYKDLQRIQQITKETNNEISFLLIGEEKPNGTVWLDTILSEFKADSRTSAGFGENINKALTNFINMYKNNQLGGNKPIICHGHSHGISPVSDNFSFGDLISYVQMTNLCPETKDREIETMGCLLPPCGDINFVMYENNPDYEGFYTFYEVYMRKNSGDAELLPSYINGNYLISKQNTNK